MKRHEAFKSQYLRTEDLNGRDLAVTIDRVEITEIRNPDGGGFEEKPVLHFRGHSTPMILNGINWATIESEYGPESDDWQGCPIVIFPTRCQFGGRLVPCMRIKIPTSPPTDSAPPPTDADAPATGDCAF